MPTPPKGQYTSGGIQATCISFIEESLQNDNVSITAAVRACSADCNFKVGKRTLHRWWFHYVMWGELPVDTRVRKK